MLREMLSEEFFAFSWH